MIIKWLKQRKEEKQREQLMLLVDSGAFNLRPVVTNKLTVVTVNASKQLDRAEQREFVEHNPYVVDYVTESLARELGRQMLDDNLVEWETEVDSMGGATVYARVRVCNKPEFRKSLSGE